MPFVRFSPLSVFLIPDFKRTNVFFKLHFYCHFDILLFPFSAGNICTATMIIMAEVLNLLHEYSLNDDIKCVVMGTSCATCDCQSELYRQPVKHQTSCQTLGEEPGGVQLLMMVASPLLLLSALFLAADACLRPPAAPVTTTTTSLAPRCSFYGPSSTVPYNVNQLRPGDIGIIGSMGDSDSAAFGARASTLFTITQEDRDISFASGTSDDWEGQTSLTNMLGQYNPDLVGGSSGTNNLLFYLPGLSGQPGSQLCSVRSLGQHRPQPG